MHECANEFLDLLAREDEQFSRELAHDRLGIGLVSAIREMDYYDYQARRHEETDERQEHMYLMRLGLPIYVRRTFEQVKAFDVPVITVARDRSNMRLALRLLSGFGFIEHGRRMAYASIAGECQVSRLDDGSYEFRLPAGFLQLDDLESSVQSHYMAAAKDRLDNVFRAAFTPGTRAWVDDLLRENVYVFRGRYMGYNADPALDEYFFVQALTNLKLRPGADSFAPHLTFGGVQFVAYLLCAAYFLSLSWKHVAFCEALIAKHPDIELGDIITVTGPREDLIGSIVDCLNLLGVHEKGYVRIGRSEAEVLYDVLSARRGNAELLSGGLMTVPFVVEYSETAIVQSVSGAQLDPIGFLLASLRHHHPRDYDRNQRTREAAMQASIRRRLGAALPWLQFRDNVTLRHGGRKLTDIDLVAIDGRTDTVLLFQLKHQDQYAGDMRKRGNLSSRLLSETSGWLETVREWLGRIDARELSATLRLRKGQAAPKVRIVAIGRHFAHFLHPLAGEPDFAYATLTQFFDAIVRLETQGDFRTMPGLFRLLREFMPHALARPGHIEPIEYRLPSLTFRVVQDGSGEPA